MVRQRKAPSGGRSSGGSGGGGTAMRTAGANSGGMWRFYTDDSPGVKVNFSNSISVMLI